MGGVRLLRVLLRSCLEDQRAKAAQLPAVLIAELVQNASRFLLYPGTHGVEQLQAFRGDDGDGLPLVFAAARAFDQPPRLQAIDQPSDVGGAVEHAAGNLAAGVSRRM